MSTWGQVSWALSIPACLQPFQTETPASETIKLLMKLLIKVFPGFVFIMSTDKENIQTLGNVVRKIVYINGEH